MNQSLIGNCNREHATSFNPNYWTLFKYVSESCIEKYSCNNQDEICHATSNSFPGSSVQVKDVLSEKHGFGYNARETKA